MACRLREWLHSRRRRAVPLRDLSTPAPPRQGWVGPLANDLCNESQGRGREGFDPIVRGVHRCSRAARLAPCEDGLGCSLTRCARHRDTRPAAAWGAFVVQGEWLAGQERRRGMSEAVSYKTHILIGVRPN